jgi:hypothetical protein
LLSDTVHFFDTVKVHQLPANEKASLPTKAVEITTNVVLL